MRVDTQNRQAVLAGKRSDPEVVGRYWYAYSAQSDENVGVVLRCLFIGLHQVHPRRSHEARQFVTVFLRPGTCRETGQEFGQDYEGQMNLMSRAQCQYGRRTVYSPK